MVDSSSRRSDTAELYPENGTVFHNNNNTSDLVRRDWHLREVLALFEQPFNDLLFEAQNVHRRNFDANEIETSTLMSIKTGRCSEDCGYCSQSARHETGVVEETLADIKTVVANATAARDRGAKRFCMGAAWRSLREGDLAAVEAMVRVVHELGMESCLTLGMLKPEQATRLKAAGLDYYNHNLDTSAEYYPQVITTHSFEQRLQTLQWVRDAGLKVCSGGIIGMGESRDDRAGLLRSLANLPEHPHSVPINHLVPVKGTPLADSEALDPLEFIRTVGVARILMPKSRVRLSAGRAEMSDEMQALCFLAGANSVFFGEQLLTTPNAGTDHDQRLFARLQLHQKA